MPPARKSRWESAGFKLCMTVDAESQVLCTTVERRLRDGKSQPRLPVCLFPATLGRQESRWTSSLQDSGMKAARKASKNHVSDISLLLHLHLRLDLYERERVLFIFPRTHPQCRQSTWSLSHSPPPFEKNPHIVVSRCPAKFRRCRRVPTLHPNRADRLEYIARVYPHST